MKLLPYTIAMESGTLELEAVDTLPNKGSTMAFPARLRPPSLGVSLEAIYCHVA